MKKVWTSGSTDKTLNTHTHLSGPAVSRVGVLCQLSPNGMTDHLRLRLAAWRGDQLRHLLDAHIPRRDATRSSSGLAGGGLPAHRRCRFSYSILEHTDDLMVAVNQTVAINPRNSSSSTSSAAAASFLPQYGEIDCPRDAHDEPDAKP